ncbi:MAG: bifunctional diaminohydroxyphosphoribosylaminopyrimidine deaminase/5-amino-6-(5-phosphoribosylamino)uracil reductase RibD [Aliishimia sp.]
MNKTDDLRYMSLALALGRRGFGRVWPNPAVGCVLVAQNRIVGRGWTQDGGRPHAEVVALAQAGQAAQGATAYVTLEPCSHTGQTGPCCDALIAAGIVRVVVALEDPDPRVSGRGLERLRDAGIEVVTDVLNARAQIDQIGFLRRIEDARPMVTLKLANSFDGRIATATGQSQWITGPEARRSVHMMRARHDAVMVGAGTARHDDPSLTVRDLGHDERQPVRVVVSRRLDIPLMGKLAQTAGDSPVWICHGADADPQLKDTWGGLGAVLIECGARGGYLQVSDVLSKLAEKGLTRVFCEGGGQLAASLLEADLVDHLVGFTAGLTIGAEGLPSIGALGLNDLAAAPRFKLAHTRAIGGDVLHEWQRSSAAP